MLPVGVLRGHQEEYLKDSPGARTGCSPTTPGPFTSSTCSKASVMIQCRLISCTVSLPWLVMRTVYSKTHSPCCGRAISGERRDKTSTRVELVTASDIGACSACRSGIVHAHDSRAATVRRKAARSGHGAAEYQRQAKLRMAEDSSSKTSNTV